MVDDEQTKRYLEIDQRIRAEHKAKADEHALTVLPLIQELQAMGTTGHREIARALNTRGVPTRYGAKWYHGTVRNLLARAAQIHQRQLTPHADRRKQERGRAQHGQTRKRQSVRPGTAEPSGHSD